jgi:CRISPR-associated protein Csb2
MRFPGGRYHATPWGHHVNEGLVEWPPSPWRLLRALIACGYAKLGWSEVPPAGKRLIESLAATLPTYRLPRASVAHSRHYMPTGVLDKGREKTTLVFDTWAVVGDGALAVRWSCAIDEEASALFARLASHLGYLGRSESWVSAEAISDDAPLPIGSDAWPHLEERPSEPGWEQISLMAPETPESYRRVREQAVARMDEKLPLPDGKRKASSKLEKERAKALAPHPTDLIDCLQKDTSWWKAHRWSQPPGSRRVLYCRRADSLTFAPPVPPPRVADTRVEMMLLSITTPSGSRTALPTRARALPQAEALHRALVAQVGRGLRVGCPELTGRSATGRPLEGHRHAHHLPLDLDGDGRLDHFLIYAPMGLGPEAQRAVRGLERVWTKGGVRELRVAIAGQGRLEDLRGLPDTLQDGITALLGPPAGSRVWTSTSPFVAPRHLKRRGRNTLEGQIDDELKCRGREAAMRLQILPWNETTFALRHTVRVRTFPAKAPPIDAGFAVQLCFAAPIRGPLALGYGSHFGLGLFSAVGAASD